MTRPVKWLVLGGLALVWLALLYVYIIDVPPAQEVPLTFRSGQAASSSAGKAPDESWDVKSLRAHVRDLAATPKKNIFAVSAPVLSSEIQAKSAAQRKQRRQAVVIAVAPPAQPPPSPEELARQQEELAAQAARQQEELAAQAARQQEELTRKQILEQMGQYRYLGYLNQNGVQKAFLGKGREIYIIRQGDTLEGKFLVSAIEASAVKILEAGSQLETVLKIKKEESSSSGT